MRKQERRFEDTGLARSVGSDKHVPAAPEADRLFADHAQVTNAQFTQVHEGCSDIACTCSCVAGIQAIDGHKKSPRILRRAGLVLDEGRRDQRRSGMTTCRVSS
ncbi:MAG TPA: hypothetical protein PLU65_10355, partial [Dokdonella sp.]|nr:hypothetical protein [Dokdonella sp.]